MTTSSFTRRGPGSAASRDHDRAAGPAVGKRTLVQQLETSARLRPAGTGQVAAFDQAIQGSRSALPFRAEMERAFGRDFSSVGAYLGRSEPMAAMGAHAATRGQDIAFADASPSKDVVAHELTHVVQTSQAGGGGLQAKSSVSRPDDVAEREADTVARDVVAGARVTVREAPAATLHLAHKGTATDPVTREHVTACVKDEMERTVSVAALDRSVAVTLLGDRIYLGKDEERVGVEVEIVEGHSLELGGSDLAPVLLVGKLIDLDARKLGIRVKLRQAYLRFYTAKFLSDAATSAHHADEGEKEREKEPEPPKPTAPSSSGHDRHQETGETGETAEVKAKLSSSLPIFALEKVTEANREEAIAVLKQWAQFARDRDEEIRRQFWSVHHRERQKLDDPTYYGEDHKGFRKQFKAESLKRKQMSGANNEVPTLLDGIRRLSSFDHYYIARGPKGIEGVVQMSTRGSYIANVATNPMNIDPPPEFQPQSGAGKALFAETIITNVEESRKHREPFRPITLFALNNVVKKIYEHFGFKVYVEVTGGGGASSSSSSVAPSIRIIERPKAPEPKTAKNLTKTEWHKESHMTMAEPEAKKFMQRIAEQRIIEIPPEIEMWMNS